MISTVSSSTFSTAAGLTGFTTSSSQYRAHSRGPRAGEETIVRRQTIVHRHTFGLASGLLHQRPQGKRLVRRHDDLGAAPGRVGGALVVEPVDQCRGRT